MFLAWRDIRSARGRFALIGTVVALVTVLVGFLTGLTGGLAWRNVSAVLALPGDKLVLAAPQDASAATFSDSELTTAQVQTWTGAAGVTSVTAIGITQTRAVAGQSRTAVAVFGVPVGHDVAGLGAAPARTGQIVLPPDVAADLGVGVGDALVVGGRSLTVSAVGSSAWYSHSPVVEVALADWQAIVATTEGGGATGPAATVLAVSGDPDWSATAARSDTQALSTVQSLGALEAFRSEIGSLGMIIGALFVISALVVGAFFTVWTVQRLPEIAVLKALGASQRSLTCNVLGEALVVLAAGVVLGTLVVTAAGAAITVAAGSALPYFFNPLTTVLPGLLVAVLGLVGAALPLRSVAAADPLTALRSAA